jgi:5-deoxy-D-glucuronate isomerase
LGHLSFSVIRLEKGRCWQFDTSENELALTILGGTLDVRFESGTWKHIGIRAVSFMACDDIVPFRHTAFTVQAATAKWISCGWAAAAVIICACAAAGGAGGCGRRERFTSYQSNDPARIPL